MSSTMQNSATTPPFRIVVLSAPSGTGKTTIVNKLLKEGTVKLQKSISATTRPPRKHEVDKQDYYFLTNEQFREKLILGEFLEYAEVFGLGYFYGTLKSEIERIRQEQFWALLEIDVQGAKNITTQHPDAVTIFITTPSEDEYERRLRSRGTESEEVIQKRLATARRELAEAQSYQYRVINDDLDRVVQEINQILTKEYDAHA